MAPTEASCHILASIYQNIRIVRRLVGHQVDKIKF